MNISPKLVRFDDNSMWVELLDGRIIGVPLVWFPRLLRAQPEQLAQYELSQRGIHWDELDEDLSIDGLLAGRGDMTHRPSKAATSTTIAFFVRMRPICRPISTGCKNSTPPSFAISKSISGWSRHFLSALNWRRRG